MEIIDNLDLLEVGDYVKVDSYSSRSDSSLFSFKRRRVLMGIVTKTNKEQLSIKIQSELSSAPHQEFVFLKLKGERETIHIPKTPRKTKKRKLKHKTQSHNKETIIHRFSKNEIRKIKNEEMLKELEI